MEKPRKQLPPGHLIAPPPDRLAVSFSEAVHTLVPAADTTDLGTLPCPEFVPVSRDAVAPTALQMVVPGFDKATVYYTTNGSTPTRLSTAYNSTFPPFFPSDTNILAFASQPRYGDSPITKYKLPTASPIVVSAIADWGNYLGDGVVTNPVAAARVWNLIRGKSPLLMLAVGDNTYNAKSTPEARIQADILDFISAEISTRDIYATFANHDWDVEGNSLAKMLDVFSYLPGKKRYWDLVLGYAHFFGLGTDPREPDLGYVSASNSTATYNSVEGQWYQAKANASTSRWKIALSHDGPYSSSAGKRPGKQWMRWPHENHGIDLIISGDSHVYERLLLNSGIPQVTTGWGGKDLLTFGTPLVSSDGATSLVRYNSNYGAIFLTIGWNQLKVEAFTLNNVKIDELLLTKA